MQPHKKQGLRWLFSFIKPQRGAILILLALSLSASALVLVQPYLTKILIDEGLLAGSRATLIQTAALMLLIGVAATALSGLNRYLHTRLSGQILFRLRETVYAHLQQLSPNFYAQKRTGDVLSRLDTDVAELQRFGVDGLFALCSGLLGLVGALSMLFFISWQLACLMLLVIPLQWLYLRRMRPQVEAQTRTMRERGADISSFLTETLPAMKHIQSAAAEPREFERLKGLNARYLTDLLRLQWLEFLTSAIPSSLTSFARAGAFLIGGFWVIDGQLALGALIAFSLYVGMAVGPIQTLLGLYMAWQRLSVSLERVQQLMQHPVEVSLAGSRVPTRLKGTIELQNLHFCYPNRSHAVFEDANLILPAGSKIGIFGPSGVGKSTFVDLLMRHQQPTQGRILVDGINIADFAVRDWRQRIALVAQDIQILRGTIADNIRYGLTEATDAAVEDAAQRANLGPWLTQLPQGINTPIGERGSQLSGGQRQRIALARALLQAPLLVIFDEATSAIDRDNEQQLMRTLDAQFKSVTRLIVSHRTTPVADADWLLRIEQGKLLLQPNSKSTTGVSHCA